MCDSSPTWFEVMISRVSDSLNYNAAFFFDFKQFPPTKNVEILSGLDINWICKTGNLTSHLNNRPISITHFIMLHICPLEISKDKQFSASCDIYLFQNHKWINKIEKTTTE